MRKTFSSVSEINKKRNWHYTFLSLPRKRNIDYGENRKLNRKETENKKQ